MIMTKDTDRFVAHPVSIHFRSVAAGIFVAFLLCSYMKGEPSAWSPGIILKAEAATESPPSGGWDVEVSERHGHSHGEDDHHAGEELPAEQITVWQSGYEIFLEHTRPVAGNACPFIVHVTHLGEATPRREGPIEFVLKKGNDSPVRHTAESPAREGIYLEDLIFPQPGEWSVAIQIPDGESVSSIDLPPIEVFESEHDAHHAPAPEEVEGVSFLKETQWKFPFRTEVWGAEDSESSLPESACLDLGEGTLVYVQISGELFQSREVELGQKANGRVEIVSGLEQGERVVTRGAEVVQLFANSEGDPHSDHGHGHGHGADHGSATIEVAPPMREALGLSTELVCKGDLVVTLDLYGWVHPRPKDVSELRAPISGVVDRIHVQPGETVEFGSPLLTLVSPEFLDWQMELLATSHETLSLTERIRLLRSEGQAKVVRLLGELRVAEAERTRIEEELRLIESAGSGSVAVREIKKLEGQLKAADAQLISNRALAAAYGLSGEEVDRLMRASEISAPEGILPPEIYKEIRADEARLEELETEGAVWMKKLRTLPISEDVLERLASHDPTVISETFTLVADRPGVIRDFEVRSRTALSAGDEILRLVDYRVVHVETEVPEIDIASVLARATDTFPIYIPGLANSVFEGRVAYFDTSVHPDVRKAHLVLEVDNVEGNVLRDNMAATVGIPLEVRSNALYVSADSVLTDGFEKVVFVDDGEHFHRVAITPGLRTFKSVEVLEGLEPDQKVVVSGGRTLLMAVNLPKGGADAHAGHGHPH